MDYLKVSIETNSASAELLADALAQITGGCEIDDPATVTQWAEDARSRWDYLGTELFENPNRPVTVNYYVGNDEAGQNTVRQASLELARIKRSNSSGQWGTLAVRIMPMENQDWETSWRAYFKPTPIGKRLMIMPSWEQA